jgi:hypothetical protein
MGSYDTEISTNVEIWAQKACLGICRKLGAAWNEKKIFQM